MIVQSKMLADLCIEQVSICRSLDEIIGTELIIKTNKNKRDLVKCKVMVDSLEKMQVTFNVEISDYPIESSLRFVA
jgi:hypothetical protein